MSAPGGSTSRWIWSGQGLAVLAFAAALLWQLGVAGIGFGGLARLAPGVLPAGFFAGLVSGATGAGSGLVLVPVFDFLRDMGQIRITFQQGVATAAFAQAFAMACAAFGWVGRLYGPNAPAAAMRIPGNDLISIVFATLAAALPTVLITQSNVQLTDRTLQTAFVIFALALGVTLLIFAWAFRRVEATRQRPERFDLYMFLLIGVAGGYVSAFFGFGIGEFLVVYLIFRKFPVYAAVAASVIVSAATVAAGTAVNWGFGRIVWDLALAAIPGGIAGGVLAHWAATAMGPLWVKSVAAAWIVVSSLAMIIRALA